MYDAASRNASVVSLPLFASLRQNFTLNRLGREWASLPGGALIAALRAANDTHLLVGGEDATSCAALHLVASGNVPEARQPFVGTACAAPELRRSPDFFTIAPSDASFAKAALGLALHLGWTRVCLVFDKDPAGTLPALRCCASERRVDLRLLLV